MKILVVTTSYGEYSDSHTIRLSNLLSKLSEFHRIDYCFPSSSSKSRVLDNEIEIKSNYGLCFSSFLMKRFKYFHLIYINLIKKFYFPDRFKGFGNAVVRYFDLKGGCDYDFILSASGSIESHIAGYKLAKRYGIKLVLDYGDPIYSLMKSNSSLNKIKSLEKKIIDYASAIVFTTESTKCQYDLEFLCGGKSSVIHYGYDFDSIKKSEEIIDNSIDFKSIDFITHIGTAFTNDRNLIPLIDAIHYLQKNKPIGFILAGRRSLIFSDYSREIGLKNFKDYDFLKYEESILFQCKSKINVIVGNKDGRQVPGKIYMSAVIGERILYISQCDKEQDESLNILKRHPNIVFCENEKNSIISGILQLIDSSIGESDDYFYRFESSNLSKKLESILDACQ
ncbi:hypothetical protein SAMN02745753_04442 [Marinomonas polaris DSM 16579]|uniref:Uncharacterized protein n=1 Tax=Marinomonas polaris DSM 16579 TaxID=1122206 RepID=A0A1M5MDE9_9GAMM|nr:hypothetical protein [Marinomonas polaris]SHG75231.1 hypothetical protein SAMN02745753_04442 [Marinomonas polaris DSM 16579]